MRTTLFSILTFLVFALPATLQAQERFAISGTITSAKTGETLIGASVRVKNTTTGTISNEYGFYSLTLTRGNYILEISAVGQQLKEQSLELNKNIVLNVSLNEETKELEAVVVRSTGRRSISNPQMGMDKLTIAETKNIPTDATEPNF